MKLLKTIIGIPAQIAVSLINVYQATLSPDHGPLKHLHPYGYCRHEPTCSEYGKRMVLEKGVLIGGLATLRRLLSCHPWTPISPEKVQKILDAEAAKS